jgi:hypothetical protein
MSDIRTISQVHTHRNFCTSIWNDHRLYAPGRVAAAANARQSYCRRRRKTCARSQRGRPVSAREDRENTRKRSITMCVFIKSREVEFSTTVLLATLNSLTELQFTRTHLRDRRRVQPREVLQQKQQKRPVVEAHLPRRFDERIVLNVDFGEIVERREKGELLQTRELHMATKSTNASQSAIKIRELPTQIVSAAAKTASNNPTTKNTVHLISNSHRSHRSQKYLVFPHCTTATHTHTHTHTHNTHYLIRPEREHLERHGQILRGVRHRRDAVGLQTQRAQLRQRGQVGQCRDRIVRHVHVLKRKRRKNK